MSCHLTNISYYKKIQFVGTFKKKLSLFSHLNKQTHPFHISYKNKIILLMNKLFYIIQFPKGK